jgi:hypothetical protein
VGASDAMAAIAPYVGAIISNMSDALG